MRVTLTLVISLALLLVTRPVFAHSEPDKARFVAEQGQDNGKCDNVLRP